MTKLESMIAEHSPGGVEYRTLGEVIILQGKLL